MYNINFELLVVCPCGDYVFCLQQEHCQAVVAALSAVSALVTDVISPVPLLIHSS